MRGAAADYAPRWARLASPVLFLCKGTMVKLMKKDLADIAEFFERPA